jgi:hypothetical protein
MSERVGAVSPERLERATGPGYSQKRTQVPAFSVMAWTVVKPANAPVIIVNATIPNNTRRRNLASA